ncbi:MAG: UbiA prenyltransferase family protein [Candidatus Gastranaerophilaceae bacterium]|nr:UbiA prenyltransferase family protein [Candidatus Gastranaerophilaceae bacterium]
MASMLNDILKLLRLNHYIKNLVVFVPLIFSKNYGNMSLWLICLMTFLIFCLISSSVYIFNDIADYEEDKVHPVKCLRPVASGKISVRLAKVLSLFLFLAGLILSFFVCENCFIFVLLYCLLNICYTLKLKDVALIDAVCIAVGFIIRIVAGCYVIKVIPSPLVILMTFFISLFFTFMKRKMELKLTDNKNTCRKSIRDMDIKLIDKYLLMNAILSVAFYFNYVLSPVTMERAGTDYLYLTVIPFAMAIFRLIFLSDAEEKAVDPISFIEHDSILHYIFILYLLIFILSVTFMK